MKRLSLLASVLLLGVSATCYAGDGNPTGSASSSASNDSGSTPAPNAPVEPAKAQPAKKAGKYNQPLPRFAMGVRMSLLGAGVEVATPLSRRTNVRVGFNMFSYSRGFDKDGVSYAGQLSFRSMESHLDWFPFGGSFHLSPGLMAYNGNKITANASVPGGQSFSLGSTDYYSDPANPLSGTGKIGFNSVAPTFMFGFGNLLPRNGRHFSVPFELGFAYMGSPKATLNLAGGACDSTGLNCRAVASDPTIQSNIQSEQAKINNSMSPFKFYPIISLGFGYRF